MNAPNHSLWQNSRIVGSAGIRCLFLGYLAAAAAGCGQPAANKPASANAPARQAPPANAKPVPAAPPSVSVESKSSVKVSAADPLTLNPKAVERVKLAFERTPVRPCLET